MKKVEDKNKTNKQIKKKNKNFYPIHIKINLTKHFA